MDDTNKKYTPMENVLININSTSIALSKSEKKRNNVILLQVPNTIIDSMKRKNPLFDGMYERNFYGGSYYDNLKVGEADEYDLDLILTIPVLCAACIECSDLPGFVQVRIQEISKLPKLEKMESALLTTDKYLSTKKVSSWFESLINSALNGLPKDGGETYVDVYLDKGKSNEQIRINVKLKKGGPAFTLNLSGKYIDGSDIKLDIDLVPCFQFSDKNWPSKNHGYRANTSTSKTRFLVVPKKPTGNGIENSLKLEKYWRLSFQEQERELINQDLKNLKPSLRLLKKLRDKHKHKIASYFIKTIFLWNLDDQKDNTFWTQPLCVVFMYMLKKYEERLQQKSIPYYWNRRFNLIENLKDSTKSDLANTLRNIITDVDRNLCEPLVNPFIVGKYLLSSEEFENLPNEVSLGKKFEKSISVATTSGMLNRPTVDATDSTDTSPPLSKSFQFDLNVVNNICEYLASHNEKKKREADDIMAQLNNRSNLGSSNTEVLASLNKIHEKMDMMLKKFDKSEEHTEDINSKVASLENQVRQLQIDNIDLRSKIEMGEMEKSRNKNADTVSPIDAILITRQIENNTSLTY